jgi:threonine synthase
MFMGSERIKYYSTNLKSEAVSFREALLKGLAPDGGLYMPTVIPVLDRETILKFSELSYPKIAFTVLNRIIGGEIEENVLKALCSDAYDFDIPLEHVTGRKYIMRLDRGPTASFKDFAARMMSRLMQHFLAEEKRNLTILTATSGDTGSAVANAFYGLDNINVIILFPVDEVSMMQRKQMTTLGKNVTIIGINGKFDDCQRLVKTAFTDESLAHLPLSSANSINTGRLLPQSVYYFYAWSRLRKDSDDRIIFSVPSGNFGNLMGGLIAHKMGLPVEKFLISTNLNGEVPEFLGTGLYEPLVPSLNCISSAMNVGHPSNLARIIALYGGIMDEKGRLHKQPDMQAMRNDLAGISISDDITRKAIQECYDKYRIILEPHGAVAWKGLSVYSKDLEISDEQLAVSLETAHPAKFPEEIKEITGSEPELPASLAGLEGKKEEYIRLENSYEDLKNIILNNN